MYHIFVWYFLIVLTKAIYVYHKTHCKHTYFDGNNSNTPPEISIPLKSYLHSLDMDARVWLYWNVCSIRLEQLNELVSIIAIHVFEDPWMTSITPVVNMHFLPLLFLAGFQLNAMTLVVTPVIVVLWLMMCIRDISKMTWNDIKSIAK